MVNEARLHCVRYTTAPPRLPTPAPAFNLTRRAVPSSSCVNVCEQSIMNDNALLVRRFCGAESQDEQQQRYGCNDGARYARVVRLLQLARAGFVAVGARVDGVPAHTALAIFLQSVYNIVENIYAQLPAG